MGLWPIHTQRYFSVRANSADNKKPLSGAFTHRYFDEALARDYTAFISNHATLNRRYFIAPYE
jgi:hypothetical protein